MTATSPTPSVDAVRIEPNPKWIRGLIGSESVVDTADAGFLWDIPYYPLWYLPVADVS